jgi:Immunity protein 26
VYFPYWLRHEGVAGNAYQGASVAFDDQRYDIGYTFLRELSQVYVDHLGRRPTLEELAELLKVQLAVSGRQLVAGLETRAVTRVDIRTKRAPREQEFAAGDVFAVPLGDGRVAFGRVMRVDKASGLLIEFFRYTAPTLEYDEAIAASGRLFHPVHSGAGPFRECRWTIVGSDPGYAFDAVDEGLEFVSPAPVGDDWCVVDLKGRILRRVPADEAAAMERDGLVGPEAREQRIRDELARGSQ